MVYCINIVTITKRGDMFDAVAVNKYPLCVSCDNYDEMLEVLHTDEVNTFISSNLKTLFLFNNAKLYIRAFDTETGNYEELQLSVPENYKFDNDK